MIQRKSVRYIVMNFCLQTPIYAVIENEYSTLTKYALLEITLTYLQNSRLEIQKMSMFQNLLFHALVASWEVEVWWINSKNFLKKIFLLKFMAWSPHILRFSSILGGDFLNKLKFGGSIQKTFFKKYFCWNSWLKVLIFYVFQAFLAI